MGLTNCEVRGTERLGLKTPNPTRSNSRGLCGNNPPLKSSKTMTLCPRRISSSATWLPMNPAPPVTSVVLGNVMFLRSGTDIGIFRPVDVVGRTVGECQGVLTVFEPGVSTRAQWIPSLLLWVPIAITHCTAPLNQEVRGVFFQGFHASSTRLPPFAMRSANSSLKTHCSPK